MPKKPIWKKWWVWVIAIIVVAGISNLNNDKKTAPTSAPSPQPDAKKQQSEAPETQPVFKISDIANKSEAEVANVLGQPTSKEDGKFRYANTDKYIPAPKNTYKNGLVEVMFIEGKAGRITFNPSEKISYPNDVNTALLQIGLSPKGPDSKNDMSASWKGLNGLYSIQAFNDSGKVSYLYVITDERFK